MKHLFIGLLVALSLVACNDESKTKKKKTAPIEEPITLDPVDPPVPPVPPVEPVEPVEPIKEPVKEVVQPDILGQTSDICFDVGLLDNNIIKGYFDYEYDDDTEAPCPRDVSIPRGTHTILEGAFSAKGLTSVAIPLSVTRIENAFTENEDLSSVCIESFEDNIEVLASFSETTIVTYGLQCVDSEGYVAEPTEFPDIFSSVSLIPQSDGGLFLAGDAIEGLTMIARAYDQYVYIWGGTQDELDALEARTDASEIAELEGNRQNYDTDPLSPTYVDVDALIQAQRDNIRFTPEFRNKSFRQDWIDSGYRLDRLEVQILVIREVYALASEELRKAELAVAVYQAISHYFNSYATYTGDSNLFESNATTEALFALLNSTDGSTPEALVQILERCQSLLTELDTLFSEEL